MDLRGLIEIARAKDSITVEIMQKEIEDKTTFVSCNFSLVDKGLFYSLEAKVDHWLGSDEEAIDTLNSQNSNLSDEFLTKLLEVLK